MRTHVEIIRGAKGPSAVARVIADLAGEPFQRVLERAKQWSKQNSIPPEYWPTFVSQGWSTLEELSAAAERSRQPALAGSRESSPEDATA